MTKISQLTRITDRSQLTTDDLVVLNDGQTTKAVDLRTLSNGLGSGYEHTKGFAGKPASNGYEWGENEGINYTQNDANNGVWKVFSLDRDIHLAVDSPYWSNPTPNDHTDKGLFGGSYTPIGVSRLFDFDDDFNTTYPTLNDFASNPANATSVESYNYFRDSVGRIDLSQAVAGDKLRVRFDFEAIPQVSNTILEVALWYSNRNSDGKETASFPLTSQPILYRQGRAGTLNLNRVELTAWIANDEDINALALPAIKADNAMIIRPIGMLATIVR